MHLVRSLLLAHAGLTVLLVLLLSCVVAVQSTCDRVRARWRPRTAAAGGPAAPTAVSGASVLEWTVDLRGVGQRQEVLRT